jgi:hypothetical protein
VQRLDLAMRVGQALASQGAMELVAPELVAIIREHPLHTRPSPSALCGLSGEHAGLSGRRIALHHELRS